MNDTAIKKYFTRAMTKERCYITWDEEKQKFLVVDRYIGVWLDEDHKLFSDHNLVPNLPKDGQTMGISNSKYDRGVWGKKGPSLKSTYQIMAHDPQTLTLTSWLYQPDHRFYGRVFQFPDGQLTYLKMDYLNLLSDTYDGLFSFRFAANDSNHCVNIYSGEDLVAIIMPFTGLNIESVRNFFAAKETEIVAA